MIFYDRNLFFLGREDNYKSMDEVMPFDLLL